MKNRETNSRNETLTQHRTVALHPSSNIRRDEAESVASGAQQGTWTPSRWWLISEKPIAAPSVHCITAIDSSHPSSDAPLCHTVDRATPWKAGAGRAAVSSVDQNFPHLTLAARFRSIDSTKWRIEIYSRRGRFRRGTNLYKYFTYGNRIFSSLRGNIIYISTDKLVKIYTRSN